MLGLAGLFMLAVVGSLMDIGLGDAAESADAGGGSDGPPDPGTPGHATGDAIFWGGDGGDLLEGGDCDDQLGGYGGADTIDGGAGGDDLHGMEGADLLAGGAGDDGLHGGPGDDGLSGDAGNDTLAGEGGDDSLAGGAGGDSLLGGQGDDRLDGGAGADSLLAGDGDDTLAGGPGADVLVGGPGDDALADRDDTGQAVRDFLDGGAGSDTLDAGEGDWLTGGPDRDDFILGQWLDEPHEAATIGDYEPGTDRIVVVYDAGLHPNPTLTVRPSGGNEGDVDILLGQTLVARVLNAPSLSADDLDLVPTRGAAEGSARA